MSEPAAVQRTVLGEALGRMVMVASAASQLHQAFEDEDPFKAVYALRAVLGESDSKLGDVLELIVIASSLPTLISS